jgi:tRNA threonylcarbamoyladenosine biosynthesis protein TsaE
MEVPTLVATTRSPKETRELGRTVGSCLHHGIMLYLMGDLGSGKTAFVQGLARGLEVPSEYYVTSPTFTLVNEYPGRLPLYHIDLYRLEDTVDFEDIGLFDLPEENAVAAVEWAERLHSTDRDEGITVRFEIQDETVRRVRLVASGLAAGNLIREAEKIAKEKPWV